MKALLPPSRRPGMLAALLALCAGPAAAHCLVSGSADAVVRADAAELRPVAAVRDCASLRLVSGSATALWTGRDGKPAAGAVRPDAAPAGYPGTSVTAPTQRVAQTLAALTTDGRGARAGYKRFDDGVESADVHVPPGGLVLPASGPGSWTLVGLRGRAEFALGRGSLAAGAALVVPAAHFAGHDAVRVEIGTGGRVQRLVLRKLPAAEQAAVEQAVAGVQALPDLDASSRALALALVYEHFGLSLNRDLSLLQR